MSIGMASRSLNKVMLIGNLTRDPELRYTPQGTAVCSFGIATNRDWVDQSGQRQEEVMFHNVVAWSKLAEICGQLLYKGRKVYVEGRLSTRSWTAPDNTERRATEVVIEEMIAFGPSKTPGTEEEFAATTEDLLVSGEEAPIASATPAPKKAVTKKSPKAKTADESKQVADDIPF